MNYGLFVRNARACENAKHPKCTCVCGGKLHGVSHESQMQTLWDNYVERERERDRERQPELPGVADERG